MCTWQLTHVPNPGLGMMVSYSIIKGMNGTIDVTGECEKGTRFILKLPIYQ
jgi:two-component system, sporulation sensor kinase B